MSFFPFFSFFFLFFFVWGGGSIPSPGSSTCCQFTDIECLNFSFVLDILQPTCLGATQDLNVSLPYDLNVSLP